MLRAEACESRWSSATTGLQVRGAPSFTGSPISISFDELVTQGTSSKSTKLIHGGVRYLQKAIFELDYDQ